MTRGSIPPFDLYEELEVSRQATPAVIEAAHRALVKRYHPDVSGDASSDADGERITRLNIARDWLLDPARRARYDGGPSLRAPAPPPGPRVRRSASEATSRPARPSSSASFGLHSREVRRFLAELRELDGTRTQRVLEARAALDVDAYTAARDAALAASRQGRSEAWGFARDAASVIVKGKVSDPATGAVVASIAADIAGAIAVRDLITPEQFSVLNAPWVAGAGLVAGAPERAKPAAPPPLVAAAPPALAGMAALTRRPAVLALVFAGLAVLVALAIFAGARRSESAVAGLTSAPSSAAFVPGASGSSASPGTAGPLGGSSDPAATASAAASLAPGASAGPSAVAPRITARPVGGSSGTPRPTVTAVPSLTPAPTAPSTPRPSATPRATATIAPAPSPSATCIVVDLVGRNTSNAQVAWSGGGFTGTVLFSPATPPQYRIGWQSLTAGTVAPCTSDITVQPAP